MCENKATGSGAFGELAAARSVGPTEGIGHPFTDFPRIVLGCEQLGGNDWGSYDQARSREVVARALGSGITAFDTADVYGLGHGEEELSRALGRRRADVTIISKGGVRWIGGGAGRRARTWRDSTPQYLQSAIAASLRRLRVDAISIYLVHWPDVTTPLEATLECLKQACERGWIRSFGLSNFDVATVLDARRFGAAYAQSSLSLLSPKEDVSGHCTLRAQGITTLAYGVLAQGLLTGKYGPDAVFPHNDRRKRLAQFGGDAFVRNAPVLNALRTVADDLGRPPAEVAIRWVLDTRSATSAIVGAKDPAQVEANCRALEWNLDTDSLARLEAARKAAGLG